MTESEARFEDIARKLATLEAELERSMDRCTTGGIKETGQMIIVIITYTLFFDTINFFLIYEIIQLQSKRTWNQNPYFAGEKKISELEEELKLVGQNLQQLEVSEEKAFQREEKYQKQIENLVESLKRAVNRDESATMNIQRLNIRIDQIEEDLLNEKLKIKKLSDEVDSTFDDMLRVTSQKMKQSLNVKETNHAMQSF